MIIQQKEFLVVAYSEVEKTVKEEYGIDFSVAEDMQAYNGSNIAITVTGKLDKWKKEDIEKVKKGHQGTYIIYALMDDMASRGIIPKGEYLIEVSW